MERPPDCGRLLLCWVMCSRIPSRVATGFHPPSRKGTLAELTSGSCGSHLPAACCLGYGSLGVWRCSLTGEGWSQEGGCVLPAVFWLRPQASRASHRRTAPAGLPSDWPITEQSRGKQKCPGSKGDLPACLPACLP